MLVLKGLAGGLVHVSLFGLFLLVPAGLLPEGTWYWPRAMLFLVLFALVREAAVVALAVLAPRHLQARVQASNPLQQPPEDRVVSLLMGLAFLGWFAFVPVDYFHLQLLPRPGLAVSFAGLGLFLLGWTIIVLALYSNEFAVVVVEDQRERGHVLRDTGLYAWVRHPMYFGFLPYLVGTALWLESYASALAVSIVLATVVARISIEEKMLRETLAGYADYARRVRYRLVPGIW